LPDGEELREFAVPPRKPGLSVKQCAKGFRIQQQLKNLGIGKETDDENGEHGVDHDANSEIISFINGVFMSCKIVGNTPSNVLS
jgi:hypothetical protein